MKVRLAFRDRGVRISELFFYLTFWLALSPWGIAQDWPQWRGPGRDGTLNPFSPPPTWPKKMSQVWSSPIGGGYSSPIVAEGRVFVLSYQEDDEVVSAFDLESGQSLWSAGYPAPFQKNSYATGMDRGPYSTPLFHQGKVFTLGSNGVLSSFDATTGNLNWRHDFSEVADTSKLFCGAAMSPLADGSQVLVHVGDDRRGWVIAFDVTTGKERWRWQGPGPGYASPILADLGGSRQLITLTQSSIIGLSTREGRLLWSIPHTDEWNENIVTPVISGNLLITSGVRQGTRAFELIQTGGAWEAQPTWHNPDVRMYMSSPVLGGDYLYGLSSLRKGQFFCLDIRSGKVCWKTAGRDAENAAILASGRHLFLLTSNGKLIVALKSPDSFSAVATYQLSEGQTWAHPVIWNGRVMVKSDSSLTLWSWQQP